MEQMAINNSFFLLGSFFNLIAAVTISFITQDSKENKSKYKFHEFIEDHKAFSMLRRSLKPSGWIVVSCVDIFWNRPWSNYW